MLQTWRAIKGHLMGVLAFVACPCHLPITLPLIVGLTAGTAFSAWLENNFLAVGGVSTLIFLGAVTLAFKWIGKPAPVPTGKRMAPTDVVLVVSQTCKSCAAAEEVWENLQRTHRFRYQRVDIRSGKGRSLAAEHNILMTPTTLVNGQVAFQGVPDRVQARMFVRQ